MDILDEIQIDIRLKHVNMLTTPTKTPTGIPKRRRISEAPSQQALLSGFMFKKNAFGWVEKFFVLWNDQKLIYYSSNRQRNPQMLAMLSRGKYYNWAPTRIREGSLCLNEYHCFIPDQSPADSFPRLHLHHDSEPRRNFYLSFKNQQTRDDWWLKISSMKKNSEPLSEDILIPSDSERGQSVFSSLIFDEDLDTDFISIEQLKEITKELPPCFQFSRLAPAFATKLDGISFQQLYNEIMDYPTLLLIDTGDGIIVIFIPKMQRRFFGTNTGFLFALIRNETVEVSRPDSNDIISMACDKEIIGISCGEKTFCIGRDLAFGQYIFGLSKSYPEFKCRSLMAFTLSDEDR